MTPESLAGLKRLGSEALGPCIGCGKLMLEARNPLFTRLRIRACGIDGDAVRRHVGLAASIAPGRDGLALASVLGSKVEPVVIMNEYEGNVCWDCRAVPLEVLMLGAMAADERQQEMAKG